MNEFLIYFISTVIVTIVLVRYKFTSTALFGVLIFSMLIMQDVLFYLPKHALYPHGLS